MKLFNNDVTGKNLIEVRQIGWADDYFRIDIMLGNVCNYKCWYCYPGCNSGNIKWPDLELLKTNLSHLLDYYVEHTPKRRFEFNMLGGEASHWPKFIEFITFLKSKYSCIINLTTNASKKMSWWESAAPHLNSVVISHHHEFSNLEHNRSIADFLYEHNVVVVTTVMMDPTAWDKCIDAVDYYKGSKRRWSIIYKEVLAPGIEYTVDQQKLIEVGRARKSNPFWFLKNNIKHKSKTQVVDENNKVYNVNEQTLSINRMNNFSGWECSLGVNWLAVCNDGVISGLCGNGLYSTNEKFNLYDLEFKDKFHPAITSTICKQQSCSCIFELKQTKRKVSNAQIIPIYHEN